MNTTVLFPFGWLPTGPSLQPVLQAPLRAAQRLQHCSSVADGVKSSGGSGRALEQTSHPNFFNTTDCSG